MYKFVLFAFKNELSQYTLVLNYVLYFAKKEATLFQDLPLLFKFIELD